jgi:hypothetical protein
MKPNFTSVARWRRVLVGAWLSITLAAFSGCVLAPEGAKADAAAYARGELEANLQSEYPEVVEATRAAVVDLGFPRLGENKDELKAVFVSRTPLDKKVEVTLTNSGKKLTNIKIRVGVFGDEELSMAILDRIKSRL